LFVRFRAGRGAVRRPRVGALLATRARTSMRAAARHWCPPAGRGAPPEPVHDDLPTPGVRL